MNFDQAFAKVIGHEGGFTNDSRDRGNWTTGVIGKGELKGTKYGISAMAYPDLDIRNLTTDQAKDIYHNDYWNKLQLDQLPDAVRFDLFDAAINSGIGNAAKFLQRAAGVTADGVIGAKTIAAANALPPHTLDKRLNGYRLMFLTDIATFNTYGKGWVRRVATNLIED